jgi:DNA-binding LacI/PurR family transcriptional regulator
MTRRSVQATIDDVARRADVSISTVSRVVNRTIPVSDAVAARVEAAMHELNYVPRTAARNLAARSTHTMGLLLTDLLGDFFAPLLYGIESGANAHGYDLLISTAGRRGPHNVLPRSLGAHNTDGLLVFAGSLTADGIRHAYSTGLPVVLIHQTPPADVPLPCVTIENKAASRAIVEHLILVHKRRRIVLLRGLENNEDAFWREAGYREALAAHQIEQDPRLCVPGDFERSVALVSVTRLLDERIEFDAIFAGDDEAAVGAYSALQRAGKRIPEDVSIVGFDDQRLASVLRPPLTTVRAPTEQVGRVAAEQLVALIRTGQAEPLTLLHGELVIRQSCGCSVSTP